jgi:uncharacterized protein
MKVAVLSDIHDNIWNLEKALKVVKEKKCESIIFCGDFCAPFVVPYLVGSGLPVYVCFGNNDNDQGAIIQRAKPEKFKVWPLAEEFAEVELDNRKIAFGHFPKLGELLAKAHNYDAVFHGHTHDQYIRFEDKTLLANPGGVCGIVGGKSGMASFMIYDTKTNSVELMEIK